MRSKDQIAPRILVVEDDPSLGELLAYNLQAEGYVVDRAERGEEAELKLLESPPDLVVLDWMLPGVSGIEICRRLRARDETKSLPVIMLTAETGVAQVVRAMQEGAYDYLPKPIERIKLLATVLNYVKPTCRNSAVEFILKNQLFFMYNNLDQ